MVAMSATCLPRASKRAVLPALALLTLVASQAPAVAQDIAGSWSGSGTVVFPSGEREKARCRATFRTSGNGAVMNATCATPSARVQQVATVDRVAPGRYRGDFRNDEFGITGSIRIVVSGNSLTASLDGGGGTAEFRLGR